LRPYYAMAKSAFRNASSITGTSEGMVDFGLKLAGRNRSKADEPNYMSFEKPAISEDEEHLLIEKFQAEHVEDKNTLTICFFGTFVSQRAVDFETCIDGIKNLPRQLGVRLIMCGDGPRYKAMLARCETVDTIFLPGRVSAKEMWIISSIADIGLLPYQPISHFEFSIPNKVPEYLASGLPILTSLTRGTVHDILRKKGLGIFYESGNLASFENAINQCVKLKQDGGLPLKQKSAKILYEEIFDAKKINVKFAMAVEQLARERFAHS
jgi:glycosyltransferase involved in cell wall biosynthesis